MEFHMIIEEDAKALPAFVLAQDAHLLDELAARQHMQTKLGNAYHVDDLKDFMKRNALYALKACYIYSNSNLIHNLTPANKRNTKKT